MVTIYHPDILLYSVLLLLFVFLLLLVPPQIGLVLGTVRAEMKVFTSSGDLWSCAWMRMKII